MRGEKENRERREDWGEERNTREAGRQDVRVLASFSMTVREGWE